MNTTSKTKAARIVQDTRGANYQLKPELSRGGQGVVYRTDHPKVLIKGFTNKDPDTALQWRSKIEWLIRQDLDGLKISKPLIMLELPRNGYVMELMDGLVPLQNILDSFIEAGDEAPQDYLGQGGIRRRIRILCQLARTLNQVHSKGMLYGDLSPANIFVSDDPEHAETWLIDCDNISLEANSGLTLHTVDYGAPEVVRGDSLLSSLTDCWSFAVIAYQLLTHNHPFKGDIVNDGEPEEEEAALRGEYPWINDATDLDNECFANLPIQLLEHSRLPELFSRCFEQGRTQPVERPSMAEWLEALSETDERLVVCKECSGHTLLPQDWQVDSDATCFFCDEEVDKNLVILEEFIVQPEEEHSSNDSSAWVATGRFVVLQENESRELKRLMPTFLYDRYPDEHIRIEHTENGFGIHPLPETEIPPLRKTELHLQRGEKTKRLEKYQGLPQELRWKNKEPYWLHVGNINEQHIVWQFRW